MGVAHQARVHPLLDVAVATAHLHGTGRDRDVVAAGTQLDERRQEAQQRSRLVVAGTGAIHGVCRRHRHRQCLLGRHHDLHELPPEQRMLDDGRAEGVPSARGGQGVIETAAHHRGSAHTVRQPRQVHLIHHLL